MTITDKTDAQRLAVQKDVDAIVVAAQRFLNGDTAGDETKLDLQRKASSLIQTVRGPVPSALSSFEEIVKVGALRTLLAAGVFYAIPKGGAPMTASEIASRTGMDKSILIRLMRAVTPFGPFRETGEEEYAHTPYSEAYLTADIAGCFPVMSDFIFGPILQICDFLRQHDWKDAITTRNNPFTLAHNCPGETMFEYLYKNPKHVAPVTKAEAADVEQMAMDLYPWEDRLRGAAQDRVAIVDIAGSHGNATRQIMKIVPALKGRRFIVQDLEPVIQEHSQALRADGIEPQVYDFLKQAQPIRGASIYYFRRVFHDWPDVPEAKTILENTAAAMDRDQSRILIHDIIIPETGATMTHAWQDLSLMAIGGIERTEKNFASLLDSAGLVLVQVWRKPGDIMGIVEARLK
ncbi:putative O-methyltransferase [Aspergillus brunneoviolaceus CBS 621.78]|uniref:O-methyltransferase n=1 Tax=Aspergillus brunneoviolaceus CBS 621.78 TaxID=1450534 RepID=A0ACD1GF13_9EURO|nr:putative O-methyltransferase [Aspergillus brunneoviolaceus CBS 621.78]RAH47817.1 putative O-methyltransferase [Aspergillus brunneoviolaceus CBS 621.78]